MPLRHFVDFGTTYKYSDLFTYLLIVSNHFQVEVKRISSDSIGDKLYGTVLAFFVTGIGKLANICITCKCYFWYTHN